MRYRWVLFLRFIYNLKLKTFHHIRLPRSTLKTTSDSGDHPKTKLTKGSGNHSHPHPRDKVITIQAVPILESTCPAPYQATQKTQGLWEEPQLETSRSPQKPLSLDRKTSHLLRPPHTTLWTEFGTVNMLWRLTKAAWSPVHIQQWPEMSDGRNLGVGPPQKLALV